MSSFLSFCNVFGQQLIFNAYIGHSLVVMNGIFYFITSFFIVDWDTFIETLPLISHLIT